MNNKNNIEFTEDELRITKEAAMHLVRQGRQDVIMFILERAGGMVNKQQVEVITDPSLGLTWEDVMREAQRRMAVAAESVNHRERLAAGSHVIDAEVLEIQDDHAEHADMLSAGGCNGADNKNHDNPPCIVGGDIGSPGVPQHAVSNDQLQMSASPDIQNHDWANADIKISPTDICSVEGITAFEIEQEAVRRGVAIPMRRIPKANRKAMRGHRITKNSENRSSAVSDNQGVSNVKDQEKE